jgi:AMMECR1 domain-containing protein
MHFFALAALYSFFNVFSDEVWTRAALDLDVNMKNMFGVFVTLTRSWGPEQQRQVHGCIGRWSPDYAAVFGWSPDHAAVSGSTLVLWMHEVAVDARDRDARQSRWSTDFREDLSTEVEVSIMMLPLLPVVATNGRVNINGKPFTNDEFGLLVEGANGKKATFLPHVFHNATWSNISRALLDKASIPFGENDFTFYAYKTQQVRFNVPQMLFSTRALYYVQKDVATFYEQWYTEFVPLTFHSKDVQVSIDVTDAVRSVSCIVDVLYLGQKFPEVLNVSTKPVLQNLDYYFQRWYKYQEDLKQASIFLLKAYRLLLRQPNTSFHVPDIQKRIALLEDAVYGQLLTLEPQFAMGEAVSTLATTVSHIDQLMHALNLMRSRLSGFMAQNTRFRGRRTLHQLSLVFELNWQSQSCYQMLRTVLSKHMEHVPYFTDYTLDLVTLMLSIAQSLSVQQVIQLETNYLAVMYECFSYLEKALKLLQTRENADAIRTQRFKFFSILLQERRGRFGLLYFKNSAVARLDITGHTLLSFL